MKRPVLRLAVFVLVTGVLLCQGFAGQVSGELRKWHKVTVTFEGPESGEQAAPNPFMDFRLNVRFTHLGSGQSLLVPGYYAADGDAANSSADTGNKWCVHFAPAQTGTWMYVASFRQGKNVAVAEAPEAGESAGFMDGESGFVDIALTDKTGRDMRARGLLQYVGKHHLRFAETGEYFLKCGADAPENFLAYAEFDGDFKTDGHKDNLIKTWAPHIKDWEPGDPTWKDGKGKGIIGAVNYLAAQGMNVFSFLPMNIEGDDRNVFPYTTYDERERLDCSRLDQWAMVFEHGNNLGMYLHFKTMETENELILDKGDLGPHRKLYYRELIARFSHNLALNWNLGEEINDATHLQKVAWAQYFAEHDPYQHHVVIHNMGDPHYDLLGKASALRGFSLQTSKPDFSQVHQRTRDYIDRSVAAGIPWVVACDEPGDATHSLITDGEDPTHDNARKNALWGNFMAGGAGVEWYFGYKHPHSDLTCQDYRSRQNMWAQCRHALAFFKAYAIPFWDMKCEDEMTASPEDYVLCKPGEVYLVYLKNGGTVDIDVTSGKFNYGWFNPRTGDGLNGLLKRGGTTGKTSVTAPDKKDWLLMISGKGKLTLAVEGPPVAKAVPTPEGTIVLKAIDHFKIVSDNGFVRGYKDSGHNALAIDPAGNKGKYAAAEAAFAGKTGAYNVRLTTMAETDGESTYRILVGGKSVGTFTNPKTSVDYKPTQKIWKNVKLKKGAKIRVEFNTATHGDGSSRGRWISLAFMPSEAASSAASAGSPAFDPAGTVVFKETGGLLVVEAEGFAAQMHDGVRKWYVTSKAQAASIQPDGDESHADSASGNAYIEVLPDTRRTHADKLTSGQNFSNEAGKMAILIYPVQFTTPGRYYVWVRAYSTGSEDNGLHVGIDGQWPDSGQRLQWCEGKNTWRWESKQRTEEVHCGEPYKIYIDVEKAGLHTIEFSMREDGFEFDKWLMTQDRKFDRPEGNRM